MTTPSKLGQALEESRFAKALSGALPSRLIEIPRLGIACRMTLLGHTDGQTVEADLWRRMRAHEMPYNTTTLYNWEAERALLVIAIAARDPEPPHAPIGTREEWERVPTDVIAELWRIYNDLREEFDPVSLPLSAEEIAEIEAAISKKNARFLRACGCRKLSSYMLTTAEPPSSSPTPKFSPMGASEAPWPPLSPDETTMPESVE